MFKQLGYLITRVGEIYHTRMAINALKKERTRVPLSILPKIHSEDFKPELKQDWSVDDMLSHLFVKEKEQVWSRLYMPLRYNRMETNTKYIEQIINIVAKYIDTDILDKSTIDLSEISFDELKPNINDCLAELSTKVFLSEHKKRYQIEQPYRHQQAIKKFNTKYYSFKTCSIEKFILDYNDFLWKSIKKSHGGINHKIPYSVYGNYDTSPAIDAQIFSLYFQNSQLKKFVAKVLAAAYRDPKSSGVQKALI